MDRKTQFFFRAGKCLAAVEARNNARALLRTQFKLRYPKRKLLSFSERRQIINSLKSVHLGLENEGENIVAFKIRKEKECNELIQETYALFPDFRHVLNAIMRKQSVKIIESKDSELTIVDSVPLVRSLDEYKPHKEKPKNIIDLFI